MSINVNDSGTLFGVNTNFDLSTATDLGLTFTSPSGEKILISSSRISAPGVDGSFEEKGVPTLYLANQYMVFTTEQADFIRSGGWYVCPIYTDTIPVPPKIHSGKPKSFSVGKAC